jgi:polyisoprenyl-phosphate glycosyltransferase
MTHLSVVIPVYNESSLIDELVKRVKTNVKLITEDFEIIIVDDGSQDNTWNLIENEAKSENRIKGIKFSRNFGHHYAITAGLHNSDGEWVVVMDGDLQDRPEVIPDLYKKAQKIFYQVLRTLSGINFDSRQANFSIIRKKVIEAFKKFPESARFYGSTIIWLGFKRTFIVADHGVRYSGRPSYTIKKRFKLASDIILSFSERPLKFAIVFGLLISTISIFLAARIVYGSFKWGDEVSAWSSIVTTILFSTGVILVLTGIIGIYIGEIFKQVKNRPLYVIDEVMNNNLK